jgi:glycosyltransferase involved in cell wall biosynthesis
MTQKRDARLSREISTGGVYPENARVTSFSTHQEPASLDRKIDAKNFVLIASDYKPRPGGIATYLDNLARGLRSLGTETTVIAIVEAHETERIAFLERYEKWVSPFLVVHDKRPSGWFGNKFVSLLEILRCSTPRARHVLDKTPYFRASMDSINRLDKVLREQQPTMIVFGHLDLKLYPFALYMRESGLPYGIIAHDSEVYRFPAKKNDLVRRGLMIKGARWIAANSSHTKSLVEMWGIPSSRIKLIHPPIAEEALRQSTTLQRVLPSEDQLNLVTISRLVKAKGIDIVIRALMILSQKRIPFRYVIAGEGGEREFLQGLAAELGLRDAVRFVGSITDNEKWAILRDSDIYVMPSRINPEIQHEGFGISFIEAAAFGVPGVGSRGGGIPDAVLDGETGILVPQESPEALAEALIFLYENPEKRREIGKAGQARARAQFSPSAVAAHFLKVALDVQT